MHSYGGIYVDWDVLLVDPAKFLAVMGDLENTNCVLLEDRNTKEPNFPSVYTNSLFYMRKGNRLALEFLEQIDRNYSEKPLPNTPELTGPLGFTRFLNSRPHYKDDSRIIDILRVYSYDYAEVKTHKAREVLKNQCRLGGAPAIHFWTHSWVPKPKFSDRLLHKISNVLKISI